MRLTPLILAATVVIPRPASADAAPNLSPEGTWRTAGGHGFIEVYRCAGDGTLCGKLASFLIDPGDPNPQGLDLRNPDPARRSRSLCGLVFMYGFRPDGPDAWSGGTVYDPESGNTYSATLILQADGRLGLHGYIGIPLFGRTETWTRETAPVPACPSH